MGDKVLDVEPEDQNVAKEEPSDAEDEKPMAKKPMHAKEGANSASSAGPQ